MAAVLGGLCRLSPVRSWLASWGRILSEAARLLAGHWPQLVVLCLLGAAGRYGFVWLAVAGSALHPTLGVLILPLAPLSNLLSLVLMMRVVAETLPAFRNTWLGETTAQQWRHHLRVAAGVLLPFIALYATTGMLKQDSRMYLLGITREEYGLSLYANADRYEYASGWVLLLLVVVALGIRKLIEALDLARRSIPIALIASYVEALWLMTFAAVLSWQLQQITDWFLNRVVVDALVTGWETVLGPVGSWWRTIVEWLGVIWGGFGAFVVIPMTWLAITAAAYQTSFRVWATLPTHPRFARRRGIIGWIQRLLRELVDPVVGPLKKLLTAFMRVAAVGAGPLLMLCITFLGLGQLQVGLAWLLRLLVGPQDPHLYPMISPYLAVVTHVFFYVILMALLPATLNYFTMSQRDHQAQETLKTT